MNYIEKQLEIESEYAAILDIWQITDSHWELNKALCSYIENSNERYIKRVSHWKIMIEKEKEACLSNEQFKHFYIRLTKNISKNNQLLINEINAKAHTNIF